MKENIYNLRNGMSCPFTQFKLELERNNGFEISADISCNFDQESVKKPGIVEGLPKCPVTSGGKCQHAEFFESYGFEVMEKQLNDLSGSIYEQKIPLEGASLDRSDPGNRNVIESLLHVRGSWVSPSRPILTEISSEDGKI